MAWLARWMCANVVALAIAGAPVGAAAEPPPVQRPKELENKPEPRRTDPHLQRLERAMQQGDLAVEQGHPEVAVQLWEEALRETRPLASTRLYRTALVHRFVSIQIRLFRKSGDLQHLADAHGLVRTRLWEYDRYHMQDPASLQEREELVERRNEIAALKRGARDSNGYRELYEKHKQSVLKDDPGLKARYRRGLGVAIAGGLMLVLGTAATATMVASGQVGPLLTATTGTVAAAGAVMLPVGIAVRRRAHKKVHHETNARIEQLFASDPPYSPFPAAPDNSPLSLLPGTLTLRF